MPTTSRFRLPLLILALLISIGCLVHVVSGSGHLRLDGQTVATKPCDPLASPRTQETLRTLAHFTCDPSAGILSGQNSGIADDGYRKQFHRTWTKLVRQRKCPTPAVMTVDLFVEIPRKKSFLLSRLQGHQQQGGIVGISMHAPNPWTNKDAWDVSHVVFEELMTKGTRANRRYTKWLREVGDILEELQRRDVTVLWRPLLEANGDWFWWGYGGDRRITKEQYKRLWYSLYDYFVHERELHNLLWVFCSNTRTGPEVETFADAYPGDEFVDIVSLNYYGPRLREMQADYKKLCSFGKVMALTEYGKKPWNGEFDAATWLRTVKGRFPRLAYFGSWHSWPKARVALADLDQSPQLLNDAFVVNLEDLVKQRIAGRGNEVPQAQISQPTDR